MVVAKGQVQADKSYRYGCYECAGAGLDIDGEYCTHCYNLEYDKLIEAFKLARGERYYAILKAILSIKGKAIVESAIRRKNSEGKITVADLLHVMMEFQFPRNRFKPIVEWLEETNTIPSGVYSRIKRSKFKVSDGLKELGYTENDNEPTGEQESE